MPGVCGEKHGKIDVLIGKHANAHNAPDISGL